MEPPISETYVREPLGPFFGPNVTPPLYSHPARPITHVNTGSEVKAASSVPHQIHHKADVWDRVYTMLVSSTNETMNITFSA